MKSFLVITGVATLIATSAFAAPVTTVVEAVEKTATKAKIKAPKETGKPGSLAKVSEESRIGSAQEARGAKGAMAAKPSADPVSVAANQVAADQDALDNMGANCAPANLSVVPLEFQRRFGDGVAINVMNRASCFGGGKIEDKDAIDNGGKTNVAAIDTAENLGIKDLNKATPEQVRTVGKSALKTFASEIGVSIAEASKDFYSVCVKCLGLNKKVCNAAVAN